MVKIIAVVLALALFAMPVFANPNKGAKSSNAADPADKGSGAGEKLISHTADAVVDVLTGEDSSKSKSSGNLPPGLAKKDKTPPGWDKGKKEGWKEPEKKDSPIQSFIKGLFGQK